jgi:hypothetical protein
MNCCRSIFCSRGDSALRASPDRCRVDHMLPIVGEAHVLSGERLHCYDTTVPVLAKGKTDTGRIWVYVRDTSLLEGRRRRPPCSITRAIGPAPIPRHTWPATTETSGRGL